MYTYGKSNPLFYLTIVMHKIKEVEKAEGTFSAYCFLLAYPPIPPPSLMHTYSFGNLLEYVIHPAPGFCKGSVCGRLEQQIVFAGDRMFRW